MILLPREAIWTCAAVSGCFREEPERGNVPWADKEKSRIGSAASSDSGARLVVMNPGSRRPRKHRQHA
jgi:hypothetical protein